MNTRTRVISPAHALFTSLTATGSHSGNVSQLHRVQSASWGFNVTREDVQQWGNLAPIDQVITEPPTVNLDFSYLVTDVANEDKLGLTVNAGVSALSGILVKNEDEKNYFILTVPEGNDANGYAAGQGAVFGIGNGFITNYSLEGAVGGFPTASVTVEGLNIDGYLSGIDQVIPAVNPSNGNHLVGTNFTLPAAVSGEVGQVTAIQPGDITLDLGASALFVDLSGISIQSFNVGLELGRENIQSLGYKFSRSKELTFPINVSFGVEVLAGDLTTGSLANILCNDVPYDLAVTLKAPSCDGSGDVVVKVDVKGAKLESQSWSNDIGSNETVSINWTAQVSSPQDTTRGVFLSGLVSSDY